MSITYPDSKNPLNFFELSRPRRGQPWILPTASDLPALPANPNNLPGYGCFSSPNVTTGIPLLAPGEDCSPGWFCPYYNKNDPSTAPVVCTPSPRCQISKTFGFICMPQGRYEPTPCLTGFYCPDPITVIPCPSGHFCPRGSVQPTKCQLLSFCKAGSSVETHYGLVLIVAVIDLIIAIILITKRVIEIRRAKQPLSALIPVSISTFFSTLSTRIRPKKVERNDDGETKISVNNAEEMNAKVEKLVEGFKEAIGQDLRMEFQFNNLSLTLPSGNTVLEGVNGQIQAGRMTAIMGPSGAGKTTFMNVLMGKVKRTGGDLKINGVAAEMKKFSKIIGYVAQEDIMQKELTVRENILYSAKIRLPRNWTTQMIEKHTDDVIDALNLSHVKHIPIGDDLTRGISGGQRKRVNVGIELVACPLALFLDEPTSGLDSTSALDLADILKSAARLGLTIVSVIHQPRIEIFERFDDVLLIAPGGKTAYFGPINNAKTYFESLGFFFDPDVNAADVLMDILSGRGVSSVDGVEPLNSEQVVKRWESHSSSSSSSSTNFKSFTSVETYAGTSYPESTNSDIAPNHVAITAMAKISKARGANGFKQMILAHNRSLLQQSRFLGAFFIEVFVGMLAGVILGVSTASASEYVGTYSGNYVLLSSASRNWFYGLYGMLVGIAIALAGGPAGVKVFGEEKPVFWRETASGHSPLSYYIGKSISVLYRLTLASLHFSALFYYLATPPIPVIYQIPLNLLNFFCIYGVAAIVSMLVRRENASLLVVIVGLFSAVFCGFGLTLDDAKDGGYLFIYNIGGNRWAAEAQFTLWVKNTVNRIYDSFYGPENYGYELGKEGRNFLVMLGLGIGYRVVAFLLLIGLNRQKQR
ncbi:hypothetical protein HDU97_005134 [Phlyctochytrium planicorne]|nr:hypothetical protein HDU97_005134 [Phlyctochytrium planicorne]